MWKIKLKGGLELTEGLMAAQHLAKLGFDAIEVSQGLRGELFHEAEFRTHIDSREKEGYFRKWAKQVKAIVSVPVMAVGGLRSFDLMEEIINAGEADFISLCRPFVREPDLVRSGSTEPLADPSAFPAINVSNGSGREILYGCVFRDV